MIPSTNQTDKPPPDPVNLPKTKLQPMFLDYGRPEPPMSRFFKPVPAPCAIAVLFPLLVALIMGVIGIGFLDSTWLDNKMSMASAITIKAIVGLLLPMIGIGLSVRAIYVIWRQPEYVGLWLAFIGMFVSGLWFYGVLVVLREIYGIWYGWK